MATCFVIQPFDQGPFDKRFDDVLRPAILAADLEPYRVDRDPKASIPIEEIEAGIRNSAVCLADISTDNPNVWFELGFAIASQKNVVLVCSGERQARFPFDIQHRSVITYRTDSTSDFEALEGRITQRLKALLSKEQHLQQASNLSPVADVEGLSQHEMVALVAVAQNIDSLVDDASTYIIRQDMEKAGFTRIATTLGLASLVSKELLEIIETQDYNGDPYTGYKVTVAGLNWLNQNQDRLVLQETRPTSASATTPF
jgi:hypothetical protein